MNIFRTTIYTALLFLTTIISVQAQSKGFAIGIKGGVNLSRMTIMEMLSLNMMDQ
jgi:hypothetical protein